MNFSMVFQWNKHCAVTVYDRVAGGNAPDLPILSQVRWQQGWFKFGPWNSTSWGWISATKENAGS